MKNHFQLNSNKNELPKNVKSILEEIENAFNSKEKFISINIHKIENLTINNYTDYQKKHENVSKTKYSDFISKQLLVSSIIFSLLTSV